jgi:hypothetical protein
VYSYSPIPSCDFTVVFIVTLVMADDIKELINHYEADVSENRVTFRTGDITNFVADAIVCP